MEEKNNIDQLFKQGLNQNFPVDANLWSQVESQIPAANTGRKGFWLFNLNSLLVLGLLSISMLLNSDTIISSSIELDEDKIGKVKFKETIKSQITTEPQAILISNTTNNKKISKLKTLQFRNLKN
jgi:hypothetical protein